MADAPITTAEDKQAYANKWLKLIEARRARRGKARDALGAKIQAMDPMSALADAEAKRHPTPKIGGTTEAVYSHPQRGGEIVRSAKGRYYIPYSGPAAGTPVEIGPDVGTEPKDFEELFQFANTK